ncbi:MAG: DUF302 domain-containing protein [Acidithiobacillales bacterium]
MSTPPSAVAFEAVSRRSFDETVARARELLAAEGFGVITEIDVRATFKKKLDVEVPPYLILGACHASSAHKALAEAPEAGVLLPCNVTVSVESGRTVVRAMNPESVMAVVGKPALAPIGAEVGAALRRVVAAFERG